MRLEFREKSRRTTTTLGERKNRHHLPSIGICFNGPSRVWLLVNVVVLVVVVVVVLPPLAPPPLLALQTHTQPLSASISSTN